MNCDNEIPLIITYHINKLWKKFRNSRELGVWSIEATFRLTLVSY